MSWNEYQRKKNMRILHLTLKKKWFDMIESGEKKEEYRELKEYWASRFLSHNTLLNPFTHVHFKNGYSKIAPEMMFLINSIEIDKAKPGWSDNWQGDVFVISLGKRIMPDEFDFMLV